MLKDDYAKWMLDDPRVNFAISTGQERGAGVRHLGIQAATLEDLGEVYGRLEEADSPVLDEGRTTCCYAQSEKSWIADPDGVVWEAFYTDGEATTYGDRPALERLAARETACCGVPS